jgi:monoamine oxidase
MSDGITKTDVLIIGGGFTGLSAARTLADLGLDDFVLIDSYGSHLGGRAFSYPAPGGQPLRYDHGAQYVGDLQNTIMAPIRDLLADDELVNGAALRLPYPWEVMVLNQKRLPFKSTDSLFGIPGAPPQLGILGALQMVGLLAEMTMIEWCIDTVSPWEGPELLTKLDDVTLWDWVNGKWWVGPEIADLVRISCEALLSVEPTELSPYYFLWYCACNDGFLTEINDGTGGPQQYWLRNGTDSLAQKYAEPVSDKIEKGVAATAIDTTGDDVVVTLDGGRKIQARRVLVATSPATAARRLTFDPPLSEERRSQLAQPMGRTLKCQIYYESDWWHHAAGDLAYDGYVGGAHYPILWVMDNSPPEAKENGGPFVLMTFTVGDMLEALGPSPTQDAIEKYITGTLKDLFQDERALSTSSDFKQLISYTWDPSNEQVGGGPNTIFAPGQLTKLGHLLNEPWQEAVFFASAESSMNPRPHGSHTGYDLFASENLPQYDDDAQLKTDSKPPFLSKYSDRRKGLGYMDGAMLSGEYAARQIVASLGKANTLPEPAPQRPTAVPPVEQPHGLADVAAVLEALGDAVAALSSQTLAKHAKNQAAAGHRGRASWLRGELAHILAQHGLLAPDATPMEALATIRDFVVGLMKLAGTDGGVLKSAEDDANKALHAVVTRVDDALDELFSGA